MKKRLNIWLKLLATLVLAIVFIGLVTEDKITFQLKQPEGALMTAGDVLVLAKELVYAGISPADSVLYQEVVTELENLNMKEGVNNYISYGMYCRLYKAFLGKENIENNKQTKDLYLNIIYQQKYREDFFVLEQDWYQGYDKVLEYYNLQDVIQEKKIEILCGKESIVGEKQIEHGVLLDAEGNEYIYMSDSFTGLSYTAVSAYVRENRLLTCRTVLQDSFKLSNMWLMEADIAGVRFFYSDYELLAKWSNVPEMPEDYREQVGDLFISEGNIQDIVVKKERIGGKLLRLNETEAEIEGYGTYRFSEECMGYCLFGRLREAEKRELSIGYDFADFVVTDGEISSFLLLRKEEMESIRVLIRSNDFTSIYHNSIEVSCPEDMIITYGDYGNRKQERIPAGEKIILTEDSDYFLGERIELTPVSGSGRIKVLSVNRSQGNPSYRGHLEIAAQEDKGLVLINEVLLEEYLYSVVPSEMPGSYPAEALKAQAICARTYGYRYMISPGLGIYGAHLDDSTGYQVYNNITENVNSTKAVKETAGELLTYEGNPVDTYYYSTSCGYGADARLWREEAKWELPYLQPVYIGENEDELMPEELSAEETFRTYIMETDESAFEKNEAWYRWSCEVEELDTEKLYLRLAERYQAVPDKILTCTGEEGENGEEIYVSQKPVKFSKIYDIVCKERLPGGVLNEIVIFTDEGTYKVVSEYNIRYIFDQDCRILRQDGTFYEGNSLLPSAYFVMETLKEKGVVSGYLIYGGGYGHGAGMSQNAAKAMAVAGYDDWDILSFFFKGCVIEDRY